MRLNSNNTWSALVAATAVSASLPFVVAMTRTQPEYDYALSRQKLETIGRALQMYRREAGFKPVSEREKPEDAGLPFAMRQLAKSSWPHAVPVETFYMPGFDGANKVASNFITLYVSPSAKRTAEISAALRDRGDRMPVLADINMNGEAQYNGDKPFEAMILRLDGTVELVRVPRFGYRSLVHE